MSSTESESKTCATPEGMRLPVPSPPMSDGAWKACTSKRKGGHASMPQTRQQRKLTTVKVYGKKKGKKVPCAQCGEFALKLQEEKCSRQGLVYDSKRAKDKIVEIQALHQIIVKALEEKEKVFDSVRKIVDANYERANSVSPVKDVVDVE